MKNLFAIILFVCLGMELAHASNFASAGYVRKIVIFGNQKTERQAILNITGTQENEFVDAAKLKKIQENLQDCGLFRYSNVSIRKYAENQIDLIIKVVEKTSVFLFPVVTAWSGRYSGGLIFGESNLSGNNKRTLILAQGGNKLSQFFAAYDDLALFNSNYTLRVESLLRRDMVPLYSGYDKQGELQVRDVGGVVTPGYRWTDEISTRFALDLKYLWYGSSTALTSDVKNGFVFSIRFEFIYDSLKRNEAILKGTAIKAMFEFADKRIGSDVAYNKEILDLENAVEFLRYFNWRLQFRAALGRDLPFNEQFTLGGINLRGYSEREFRGDTLLSMTNEVTFPVFSKRSFALRGIAFADTGLTYFHANGIKREDYNSGVGGGLRVYMKKVVMPLLGLDFAWGIDDNCFGAYFSVGLTY